MSELAIVVLAFVLMMAVMMALATAAMNVAAPRMIGAKHHDLESIIETKQVPQSWRAAQERSIGRLRDGGGDRGQIASAQQRAMQQYIRRLDSLVAYVQRSTLVKDEETRHLLLDELAAVRAQWQATQAESEQGMWTPA